MDLDIRKAVKANFSGASYSDVWQTITSSIKAAEEKTLPGLGVLLEVWWQGATDNERNSFANAIANHLH